MQKIRVGVVYGGPSSEHEVSLETGKGMLENLPDRYEPVGVFVDRDGSWSIDGQKISLDQLPQFVDVVLNAMHGEYGEDGRVQRDLEQFGIPYTGSGVAQSAMAFNKEVTKKLFKEKGIRTAAYVVLNQEDATDKRLSQVFRTELGPRVVVKPVCAGSSVGVSIAATYPELVEAVRKVFTMGFEQVIIEQYVTGREATCGVINDFRGESTYTLPPVEIIPPKENGFFDYDAKYSGETQEICPANFTDEEKREIQEVSRIMHDELGLKHYSRSDFIVSPHGVYALEVNTLPGMTPESLLPKPLAVVGCSYSEFLDHIVSLARK